MSDETLWLTITNIALGVVTVICLFAFGGFLVREVLAARRSRVRVPSRDAHELILSDLGVTMADGGEEIDEEKIPRRHDGDDPGDNPNIIRSVN